ncbi:hypothetical protein WMY93_032838 [Mugilogobius chulae]|uniref:Uncharacterized protein n=1 Tax=Mugilogobius chulae TaxID=88201 RepID=A0AAW0MPR2_9GOBI
MADPLSTMHLAGAGPTRYWDMQRHTSTGTPPNDAHQGVPKNIDTQVQNATKVREHEDTQVQNANKAALHLFFELDATKVRDMRSHKYRTPQGRTKGYENIEHTIQDATTATRT